jgi:hypothetical protein
MVVHEVVLYTVFHLVVAMNKTKRKRDGQKAGKGQNEAFVIANPIQRTRITTDDILGHVPENGGT